MSFAESEIIEWRIPSESERRHLTEVSDVPEEEIERQLAQDRVIRVPSVSVWEAQEFTRINIGGKPISEMIIEERR
jgi:hypothetical protein